MEFLKWIGCFIAAALGLCALALVIAFLWFFGTIIGAVVVGGIVIVLVASGLKEYFESDGSRDA